VSAALADAHITAAAVLEVRGAIAVIGPEGCGKTALIHELLGLEAPLCELDKARYFVSSRVSSDTRYSPNNVFIQTLRLLRLQGAAIGRITTTEVGQSALVCLLR
jgi:ABC-type molybdate transport system ATPase subunit